MSKENLIIFDTTMRDGEQSPGASMTRDEKLVVFHDFRLKPELCRFSDGRWINRRGIAALPLIRSAAASAADSQISHVDGGCTS